MKQLLFICFIILSGCASKDTFSELSMHETLAISEWNQVEKIELEHAQKVSFLTDLVSLPQLNQLIKTTLLQNPSLQQQIITAEMLLHKNKIVRSSRLPSVYAQLDIQKNLESSSEEITSALQVSWEVDLWLKLRDENLSVQQEILAEQANLQAFQNSLIANLMQTYIVWIGNLQLLRIEQNYLQLLIKDEKIIQERYKQGLGSLSDLDLAKLNRLQVEAAIVALEEEIRTYSRQLSTISGQSMLELEKEFTFPEVILPLSEIPAQTLEGRPDLQAAFYEIKANEYSAKAAYKEMLPSINLQTLLSSTVENPTDILSGSFVWTFLGNIAAPLFQAGRLKNEAELADLQTELSYYKYKETLLKAVEEVSNALGREESLSEQEIFLAESYESALRSTQSYEQKYRDGLIDILDLLAVQKTTFDIERSLIQVRTAQLNNRISLGLALGLGVENDSK